MSEKEKKDLADAIASGVTELTDPEVMQQISGGAGDPYRCTATEGFGCNTTYACRSSTEHSCTHRFDCGDFTE